MFPSLIVPSYSAVMTSPSTLPFTSSQALPIDLYEPLFATHLQGSEFQQWLLHKCSWRLCIIGPPGSGKVCIPHFQLREQISKIELTHIFIDDSVQSRGQTPARHIERTRCECDKHFLHSIFIIGGEFACISGPQGCLESAFCD